MDLWIPITIAAGFFQNLRSAIQKQLKGDLSTLGAAYARFVYALPLALLYLFALNQFAGFPIPEANWRFLAFCFVGGICQILFTVFLLWTFSFKSFAVGTTFSKLEVIMAALVAAIVFDETISQWAIFSICLSSIGVLALSIEQKTWRKNQLSLAGLMGGLLQKSTFLGLMSAVFLGSSSALYRGATQALDYQPFYVNAAYTLVVALTIQTIAMGIYMLLRQRTNLWAVFRHWRWASLAGLTGALATLCWFTALTLQKVAIVRAVGQSELVFTFIATLLFFREKISPMDYLGVFLITSGILLLLLLG